jgi:predicted nucleic acid-binding protein
MSFLVDTDLLSLLGRKNAPAKLTNWIAENEREIFISVVSFAEIEFGVSHAPGTHSQELRAWFTELRRNLGPATEDLTEGVLVRWKELLAELKSKKRTLSCEDSLLAATALYHGHTVVTHNVRHFSPAGVNVYDPLA